VGDGKRKRQRRKRQRSSNKQECREDEKRVTHHSKDLPYTSSDFVGGAFEKGHRHWNDLETEEPKCAFSILNIEQQQDVRFPTSRDHGCGHLTFDFEMSQ